MQENSMDVIPFNGDFENEFSSFIKKLNHNNQTFCETLSSSINNLKLTINQKNDSIARLRDDVNKLEVRITNLREEINSLNSNKDRVGREYQHLAQQVEQLSMDVKLKNEAKERELQQLAEMEQKFGEKKQIYEEGLLKSQDPVNKAEKGIKLFKTHFGLSIRHTIHGTLVFSFTQISRSIPFLEHFLELKIEGDNYNLITSNPEVPNLKQLEDKLNKTNNFLGFLVHIRKIFQKTHV